VHANGRHCRGHRAEYMSLPGVVGVAAQRHRAKTGIVNAPESVDPADDLGGDLVGLGVVGSGIDLGRS
jgi:hypothetical protein